MEKTETPGAAEAPAYLNFDSELGCWPAARSPQFPWCQIAHTVVAPAAMPTLNHQRSRKRVPKPDRRRALELLASSPDGYTEALMVAFSNGLRRVASMFESVLISLRCSRG